MGKFKVFMAGAKAVAANGAAFVRLHSPAIMVAGGIFCGVASTVMACKATTKVQTVIDEHKKNIQDVEYAASHPEILKDGVTYTAEDAAEDKKIFTKQTVVAVVKSFALPAILGATSIALILGGYKILHARNVAITTAFNSVTAAYANYRKRVIDEQGEVMDRHFLYGTKLKKVVTKDPETGEEKVEYEEECPEDRLQHGFIFDDELDPDLCWDFSAPTSPEFRRNGRKTENYDIYKDIEEWAQGELKRRGWLLAYEICLQFNLPMNRKCFTHGWMRAETGEEKMKWNELSIGVREFTKYMLEDKGVNGWELRHQDAYPVYMNAWEITKDPIFYTRYRPYAGLVSTGMKFAPKTSYGKFCPAFKFAMYPHNLQKKLQKGA